MVDYKVFYKRNEYLPELLTVRVMSTNLKFFFNSLEYLREYAKVKVHVCSDAKVPTLQFCVIGRDKLDNIVRDLDDIKQEVAEDEKEALKHLNSNACKKDKNDEDESVKDYHNQQVPGDYDDSLNRNDSSHHCGVTDAKNDDLEEELPHDDETENHEVSEIRIELHGDEDLKRKFVERLVPAVLSIAKDIMKSV